MNYALVSQKGALAALRAHETSARSMRAGRDSDRQAAECNTEVYARGSRKFREAKTRLAAGRMLSDCNRRGNSSRNADGDFLKGFRPIMNGFGLVMLIAFAARGAFARGFRAKLVDGSRSIDDGRSLDILLLLSALMAMPAAGAGMF